MRINPLFAIDFYKASHIFQYPENTEYVYSNLTPLSSKLSNLPEDFRDGIVFFGLDYFIKSFLLENFSAHFFNRPKEDVLLEYKDMMDTALGGDNDVSHIGELHDLGYLPIHIRALPEGSFVPIGVPVLTIVNTDPKFFWLTNFLESVMSCMLWKPSTSATTARFYRKIISKYSGMTGGDPDFIDFQAHDFSFRGMSGVEDAALSGAGHLTSFKGTDTVSAIQLINEYYRPTTSALVGASVAATEHSVMSMGTADSEFETFKRLITEVHPTGILSIVSDTWDLWRVLTDYMPRLKDEILARDGKIVIRPDSGDPVKIVCGDPEAEDGSPQKKGVISLLAEVFGTSRNNLGYEALNDKVGAIYGDSITPQRCSDILAGLEEKGFCTDCIVFGVGSFTYTYVTRDTWGFAVKATLGVVDGEIRQIYKDPVTDDGTKKSLRGGIRVYKDDEGKYFAKDGFECLTPLMVVKKDEMNTAFIDGSMEIDESIGAIRRRVLGSI